MHQKILLTREILCLSASVNFELRLESCGFGECILLSVEDVINVEIGVVGANRL